MGFKTFTLGSLLAAGLNAYAQGPPGGPGGPGGGFPGDVQPKSPDYTYMFQYPLPIPPMMSPTYTDTVNGVDIEYYELTLESLEKQIYPDLGTAKYTGYNGMVPGPTFRVNKGVETVVRLHNQGSEPAALHLHGSPSHAPWDGWAEDLVQPGQFKDYYYPNVQAGPLWYHDHVDGATGSHVYYGQAGVYQIYNPEEDALGLPMGDYDVPLTITDKVYQSNGDLSAPEAQLNFYGDVIQVNEQPWPYLNVEPRQYRFRLFDMSLSRPYDLSFVDENNNKIGVQVVSSDAGLFNKAVETDSVVISMGERYEVVIDFASYKGSNITLMNAYPVEFVPELRDTDKVMRFVVGNTVTDETNNGPIPDELNPTNWPLQVTEVDATYDFTRGGDDIWTINGEAFSDVNNRVIARPQQGSAQLWQFNYAGGPGTHPVHIHLVNFQIVSRTGGARGLLPYESAGLKDEVLLAPGEQVQARAFFGPWNGLYMFHCHNMIHEDHLMMDVMNVTLLKELGYQFNTTWDYSDPMDPRWAAKDYDAGAYEQGAIASTVSKLGNLNAYKPANALATAATQYFGGGSADNGEGSVAAPGPSGAPSDTPNRRRHARGFDMPSPAPAEPTPS